MNVLMQVIGFPAILPASSFSSRWVCFSVSGTGVLSIAPHAASVMSGRISVAESLSCMMCLRCPLRLQYHVLTEPDIIK